MLKAIFYARFHPERGPSIIHQYPKRAIISPHSNAETLLDFSSISSYVIPPYELCDKALSVCTNGHCVLGFPISLEDEKYERNRFTFNVCFVLEKSPTLKAWDRVVSKTAGCFRDLEETEGLLQLEEQLEGLRWAGEDLYPAAEIGIVYGLLKSMFEELNTYGEACVRISNLHVLNLRLASAYYSPQPTVNPWDVPLLVRLIADGEVCSWDLTLQRIYGHIDGINHVQAIAELADADVKLVKRAVGELVRLGRAVLLDIFHFQAVYALTLDFAWFVQDEVMQRECSEYVDRADYKEARSHQTIPQLIALYRCFGPGTSVSDFVISHRDEMAQVDVRRLVTFAVTKGFLRRIHKYALSTANQTGLTAHALPNGSPNKPQSMPLIDAERDRAWKQAAFSSGWTTPPLASAEFLDAPNTRHGDNAEQSISTPNPEQENLLRSFLDGTHCMDEICVSFHLNEKQLLKRIQRSTAGEYILFNK